MVRIRLRRVGARNQPSYRIVAADRRAPRDGKFLEILGHYNPRTEPALVKVNEARLFYWLQRGAQPSESVVKVLRPLGVWERWERFRKGEPLEALLAEAEAAQVEVDARTRRDDVTAARAVARQKAEAGAETEPAEAMAAEETPEASDAGGQTAPGPEPADETEAPEPAAEGPAAGEPTAEEAPEAGAEATEAREASEGEQDDRETTEAEA